MRPAGGGQPGRLALPARAGLGGPALGGGGAGQAGGDREGVGDGRLLTGQGQFAGSDPFLQGAADRVGGPFERFAADGRSVEHGGAVRCPGRRLPLAEGAFGRLSVEGGPVERRPVERGRAVRCASDGGPGRLRQRVGRRRVGARGAEAPELGEQGPAGREGPGPGQPPGDPAPGSAAAGGGSRRVVA